MSNEPLVIESLLNSPVATVWNALTINDEIKKWYFQLEAFDPKPGFQFSFTGGPEDGIRYIHLCEITEVIFQKKLAYSWRYEGYPGNSMVTWELEPQGDKTLLRITHTGIGSMEINGPGFSKASFTQGWTYFSQEALPNYLEEKS